MGVSPILYNGKQNRPQDPGDGILRSQTLQWQTKPAA
jgi:hypothetical protein